MIGRLALLVMSIGGPYLVIGRCARLRSWLVLHSGPTVLVQRSDVLQTPAVPLF